MVIQTTQLEPPEPNRTDDPAHLTSLDPTGANQSDAEHPPTDLAVGGSSPSRRATSSQVSGMPLLTTLVLIIFGPVWSALVDDQGIRLGVNRTARASSGIDVQMAVQVGHNR
jgi:hypothetical protein